jgi:hypothetical protein
MLAQPHDKVVWLDVPVQKMLVMHVFDALDLKKKLVGEKKVGVPSGRTASKLS